ncbi:ankyrin [Gonapodya prolifera JEL478]|uniref:Ankyrin n=1 Tax=Gonapodya prolifera (strain JEL478) TaxID=1344416 RepID=A0A139AN01_GONPJ|nr:ankyrin [Gonapodya prolifera JEL478]|eukprot:KXS17984.1 ankyrin [Gonapodya prolifera JEL478]
MRRGAGTSASGVSSGSPIRASVSGSSAEYTPSRFAYTAPVQAIRTPSAASMGQSPSSRSRSASPRKSAVKSTWETFDTVRTSDPAYVPAVAAGSVVSFYFITTSPTLRSPFAFLGDLLSLNLYLEIPLLFAASIVCGSQLARPGVRAVLATPVVLTLLGIVTAAWGAAKGVPGVFWILQGTQQWTERVFGWAASDAAVTTVMIWWATMGLKVVHVLLTHGADARVMNGSTLAQTALRSSKGHYSVVNLLLNYGADIHAEDDLALRNACSRQHVEIAELLLDRGANLHAREDEVFWNACRSGSVEVVKFLCDKGKMHVEDEALLNVAVRNGYVALTKEVLRRGADVHAGVTVHSFQGPHESKALLEAVTERRPEMVKLLLSLGVNIHAHDDEALIQATKAGDVTMLTLLLDRGADVHSRNDAALVIATKM